MTMVAAEGGPATGPTVLRMLLGAQLRRLREASGVTREDAGWEIRSSESKISRMELGRVGFKERDVADLLTLYGVDRRRRSRRAARRWPGTPTAPAGGTATVTCCPAGSSPTWAWRPPPR